MYIFNDVSIFLVGQFTTPRNSSTSRPWSVYCDDVVRWRKIININGFMFRRNEIEKWINIISFLRRLPCIPEHRVYLITKRAFSWVFVIFFWGKPLPETWDVWPTHTQARTRGLPILKLVCKRRWVFGVNKYFVRLKHRKNSLHIVHFAVLSQSSWTHSFGEIIFVQNFSWHSAKDQRQRCVFLRF